MDDHDIRAENLDRRAGSLYRGDKKTIAQIADLMDEPECVIRERINRHLKREGTSLEEYDGQQEAWRAKVRNRWDAARRKAAKADDNGEEKT